MYMRSEIFRFFVHLCWHGFGRSWICIPGPNRCPRSVQCDMREVNAAAPDALFSEAFARDTLETVRKALYEKVDAEDDLEIRDFACTLLVAIVSREVAVFWQIGDGAICFRVAGSEQYQCAYWPEKGEYSNVTFFITDIRA